MARHSIPPDIDATVWFAALIETAADGMIAIDSNGIVALFNPAAERLFGYAADEVIGNNVKMLTPAPYFDKHDGYLRNYRTTGERKIIGIGRQVTGKRKDGTTFPMFLSVGEARTDDKLWFVGIVRDLTEDIKRQEELRQAQKLTAIGELTGGIAHDFNNLLTVIIGNHEMLEGQIGDAEARQMLNDAREAAEMGAELTNRLLAFARRQMLDAKPIDLNDLVAGMRSMLVRTLGEAITIETNLQRPLGHAFADPGQVESALLNLAVNARDAMPTGGRLVIETADSILDEDYAEIYPEVTAGPYVRLAVTDDGAGMSRTIAERAIEPFFTTKDTGEGTGLGLSTIYGFAKQSGGHLNIYSEPGFGTCVNLYLPVADGRPSASEGFPEADQDVGKGRGETILVVEDDPRVRRLLGKRLRRLGYVAHEAPNAPQALDLLDAVGPVDLLLTDIVMPGGMTGPELAVQVGHRHPGVKVLFTSGYPDRGIGPGPLDPDAPLLRKPYDGRTLARMLREIFDT